MLKLLIFAISLFIIPIASNSEGVNIEYKTAKKEIVKILGVDFGEWKEIIFPESWILSVPVNGKYFSLNDGNKYVYIGRVNSCRSGGCSNPSETLDVQTPEYFDYFIVFEQNLAILQVKVFNYQATHGQEVSNKGWLKQFKGYDGKQTLTIGKSIDAISGATVSVYGITKDIQEKTRLLKKIIEGKN